MQAVFGDHRLGIPYRPIAELLAHYRERDPGKTAIVDLDQAAQITFGELDRVATDIAAFLKRHGVRKGSRVLLLSDENLEKLLLWFGIWRLGAVVCPLNIEINAKVVALTAPPRSGADRLSQGHRRRCADRGRRRRACASASGRRAAAMIRRTSALPRCRGDAARRTCRSAITREDIACIFCTSGTTAGPRSWSTTTAAYWLNGLDTLEFLGLTEDDRTLEYRSFGWNSAQVLSLMPFLQKGLTLHIARRFSHSRFFEWVRRLRHHLLGRRADRAQHAAAQAARLARAKDVPTLRLMSCSTAPLTAQQWRAVRGDVRRQAAAAVRHVGGRLGVRQPHLQEPQSAPSACRRCTRNSPSSTPTASECPPGVEGEVTAGGPQTAIGYLLDDGSIEPMRGQAASRPAISPSRTPTASSASPDAPRT